MSVRAKFRRMFAINGTLTLAMQLRKLKVKGRGAHRTMNGQDIVEIGGVMTEETTATTGEITVWS